MKLSGTSWETFSDSENGAHAMAPLDAAVFVVPLGYGAGLPLPRLYLAKYLGSAEPQRAAWHVGMLGGVYTFALFLFAPGWGRISDQHARTQALMAGFAAFLVGSAIAAMAPHLGLVYRARIVVGAGAGAIMPAAQAFIANNGSPVDRSRRFVGLGSASLLRFVVGPAFETWLAGSGSIMGIGVGQMQNMFNWPSLLVAAVGIPILLLFPLSLGAAVGAISLAPTAAPTTSVQWHRFLFASMLLAPTRSRRARRSLCSGTRCFATDRPRP